MTPPPDAAQPSDTLAEPLRALACQAARAGGAVAAAAYGQAMHVEFKADLTEVTEYDRAAEAVVVECLRAVRPDDRFVGEEAFADSQADAPSRATTSEAAASDEITWIIDPIDGTRNFTRGAPLFACSVAAMQAGQPIAAAVYDPLRDEMFSAAAGGVALVADYPIHVAPLPPPEKRLVVAIPSFRDPRTAPLVRCIADRHVVRNLGCTTLHMAMVAAGRIDAALMSNCKLWDIAAGWLIITAAGGVATNLQRRSWFPLDPTGYRGQSLPTLVASPPAAQRIWTEWQTVQTTET